MEIIKQLLKIKYQIKLPEESYYVSVAPVDINIWWIIGLNIGTLLISLIFLIIPSLFVSKIQPVKAIRFQ
jgi:lipoprotein-releasing system permease protein